MYSVELYSDGGGNKDSSAGAGCILRWDGNEVRFVSFLGEATNNESEIFAALLGLAYIQARFKSANPKLVVKWVSDSEYVLKSATAYIKSWQRNGWRTSQNKPVKNQGYWKTYLALADGLLISGEHVYGHSGHPENEACDMASTWARENGLLYCQNSARAVIINQIDSRKSWEFIDARSFLQILRQDNISDKDTLLLVSYFRSETLSKDLAVHSNHQNQSSLPQDQNCNTGNPNNNDQLSNILKALDKLHLKITKLPYLSPKVRQLSEELEEIIRKYSK